MKIVRYRFLVCNTVSVKGEGGGRKKECVIHKIYLRAGDI